MSEQKGTEQITVHNQAELDAIPADYYAKSVQERPSMSEKLEVRAEDWADMPEQRSFLVDFSHIEEDGAVRRMDFYRYAREMQMPNPTFIEMTADTNRYVTGLIAAGHVTPWEALRVGESAVPAAHRKSKSYPSRNGCAKLPDRSPSPRPTGARTRASGDIPERRRS